MFSLKTSPFKNFPKLCPGQIMETGKEGQKPHKRIVPRNSSKLVISNVNLITSSNPKGMHKCWD